MSNAILNSEATPLPEQQHRVPEQQHLVQEKQHRQEEQHRRSRRERFAFRTIKADFACRLVLMAVRILSIPISIRLLGNERYGLWLTAGALLMWVNLSQLGLGGGLINELGKAFGQNNREGMRRFVSTAYCSFAVISVVIMAIVVPLSYSRAVTTFLGVDARSLLFQDAHSVFLITGVLLAATIFVNAIVAVCTGLQETYLYLIAFAIGNALNLAGLLILTRVGATLSTFTWAMGVPVLAMNIALTLYFFGWRHRYLRPRWALVDLASFRALLSYGGPLVFAQLADLAIFNSASPLIASRLGVGEVPRYAVALSLFMIVVNICDGIVRAYLGGYCEAFGRRDWSWIQSVAKRTRWLALGIMASAACAIVWLGPMVLRRWAGKTIVPSEWMLAWMAIYCFLMVCSNTNTVLLLGLGKVRLKAASQVFVAAAHIFGFFALAPRLGLLAIPVAGSIGYLVDVIVSYTFTFLFMDRQLRGPSQMPEAAAAL